MNSILKQKSFFERLVALLFIGFCAMLCAIMLMFALHPRSARAQPIDSQGQPQSLYAWPNFPATITANTTSNLVGAVVTVIAGHGLGMSWIFNGSTNASLTIVASKDGSNYDTVPFAILTSTNLLTKVSGTGTNVTAGTNWSSAQLTGIFSLMITNITTTGGQTLTNGNNSTNGIIVNRPN